MESTANRACGVHGARLNLVEYAVNFSDSHAP